MHSIYASLAAGIDPGKKEPLYRQIFSLTKRFIEEERLPAGERLPPERRLMKILGVSRSTLRLALADLIKHGYISATQGRGNFVLEPKRKKPLRILAIERFRADHWTVAPLHYDWINEAGKAAGARIHYHYAPTIGEMQEELASPSSGYHAILIFRALEDWSEALFHMPDEVFENSPIPIMVIGRPIRKQGLNTVTWDYRKAAFHATQHLIVAGHRRIGFICGRPVQGHSFSAFHEGYVAAMKDAGLSLRKSDQLLFESPLFVGGTIPEEIKTGVSDFLHKRAFTAVVPVLVSGAFENAVFEQGIRLPQELSVIMVTEESGLKSSVFRWTAFLEPSARIVQRGISLLADICRGKQKNGVFELLPPEEQTGATVKKISGDS